MVTRHVVQADSDEHRRLHSEGWVETHRSFGAQLDAERANSPALQLAVERTRELGSIRELGLADVPAVLRLDRSTLSDYPGGQATVHTPLIEKTAEPTPRRRAFGFCVETGALLAVTYVDVTESRAETDFTVVDRGWRGRGLASAVKAASVLALMEDGIRTFRTGGSAENVAIIRANTALGYRMDEEWVTLELA